MTLAEVLVSTVITSVVLGGTMTAFVTAARLQNAQGGPMEVEAGGYAQEWLESLRNRVAADDNFFQSKAGLGWQDDDPITSGPPEIIKRRYQVDAQDCDGDGVKAGVGTPPELDCYAVTVKVCWNQPGSCP